LSTLVSLSKAGKKAPRKEVSDATDRVYICPVCSVAYVEEVVFPTESQL
jgi:hypothetical protein